ncbi:MAG: hypothetical protein WCI97_05040, partial [Bacteroidota bacterium]
ILNYPLSINNSSGKIFSDGKTFLHVQCKDGLLDILELQMEGKKKLKTEEFLRGFRFENEDVKFE